MKGQQLPFGCKYIWGSRELENELKKISEKLKAERQLYIGSAILTHQLALDIKKGRIQFEPQTIQFRNSNHVRFNDGKKAKI